MDKLLLIERRLKKLETLINESKADQERLLNFLGQEYYDKYNSIKYKIKDPEYKDIYKLIKKDPDDAKDFIDNFKSGMDKRKDYKSGAKLIYNENGWKVYRITTYEAARYYGKSTKWCITGNYAGHEERGKEYFYSYIRDYDLDGGYYFFIKSDTEKYCLLVKTNEQLHSIWNVKDIQINEADLPEDFPDYFAIISPNLRKQKDLYSKYIKNLFSKNLDDVKEAVNSGLFIDSIYNESTAAEVAASTGNLEILKYLVDHGANTERLLYRAFATSSISMSVIKYLVAYGCDCSDIEPFRFRFITDPSIIYEFAKHHYNFTKTYWGENALCATLVNKKVPYDVVKAFLDVGTPTFNVSELGVTTLTRALDVLDANILKLILSKCNSKELNYVDNKYGTILHYAVESNAPMVKIKIILDASVDPNVPNKNGKLPVEYADKPKVISLIEQYM